MASSIICENLRNSAMDILHQLVSLKDSNNTVPVIKAWYRFAKNKSENELENLAYILGTFFNRHYGTKYKKYENLFIVLGSALIENDTDHPIDKICSQLKNDSLDETDTKMLLRIIEI
jgi:hypothetical protein